MLLLQLDFLFPFGSYHQNFLRLASSCTAGIPSGLQYPFETLNKENINCFSAILSPPSFLSYSDMQKRTSVKLLSKQALNWEMQWQSRFLCKISKPSTVYLSGRRKYYRKEKRQRFFPFPVICDPNDDDFLISLYPNQPPQSFYINWREKSETGMLIREVVCPQLVTLIPAWLI